MVFYEVLFAKKMFFRFVSRNRILTDLVKYFADAKCEIKTYGHCEMFGVPPNVK